MDLSQLKDRLDAIEHLLVQQKSVFTPKEAAQYMGISLSTLYKMTSAGILPYSKPNGKLIYFGKNALDQWLLNNISRSASQNETEAATYISKHK